MTLYRPARTAKTPSASVHAVFLVIVGLAAFGAACGDGDAIVASHFPVDSGKSSDATVGTDAHKVPGHDSGSLGDGSSPQPTSLELSPATATVTVTGNGPVTASFTLKGKLPGGGFVDVQAQSVQFDRPDLATVASPKSAATPIVVTAPSSAALYGGTGTLHVVYQGLAATAKLTVKVAVTSYGAGLTASSPSVIALAAGGTGTNVDGGAPDGSTAADGGSSGASLPPDTAASILYPYDKTVWPLGLTSPRVMWNAPATGDVYRVHYAEASYSYDAYFILGALPAQAPLDQTTWDHLSASNGAKNGPDPLSFSLSRYDASTSKAYLTASETWTIAPESLAGAIYYWSASENAQQVRVGRVSRFRPGSGSTPQALYDGECVGCHAVNAQGTVLVGDVDDTAGAPPDAGAAPAVAPYTNGFSLSRAWASFDITQTNAPLVKQTTEYGADLALTPDGKYVVFGGKSVPQTPGSKYISLSDLNGNVVANSGLDSLGLPGVDGGTIAYTPMMPAFSPDGTKLALVITPTANDSSQDNVLAQVPNPNPAGLTESIAYLTFDETGPSFDPTLNTLFDSTNAAFATLGPGGTAWNGIGYPSFTPDSKALAFHVGQYATGCNSFNAGATDPSVACGDFGNDNGALFIATLAAKTPIRMANADTPPLASDAYSAVEPTFNPVVRGGYSWVVFTSLRQFGNQPWPGEVTDAGAAGDGLINAKRRLWVAAVDTTIGTVDPSHPAIYLEGQDPTPNMRAFWTLASCIATPGAPSSTGLDGGTPLDAGKPSSDAAKADAGAADGGTQCTNGFQCCSGFCEGGQCVDVSTLACVGTGGACSTGSDCCNPSVVACDKGACTVKPPP
jgi:mono/diheme cytochrome c family protein